MSNKKTIFAWARREICLRDDPERMQGETQGSKGKRGKGKEPEAKAEKETHRAPAPEHTKHERIKKEDA